MRRRTAERGEGNLGCIMWVLLAAIGALIAWKAIPVKVSSSELYDYLDEMARFSAGKEAPEEIKKKILAKANELRLPLDKDHCTVEGQAQLVRLRQDLL